jgi:hypothetical protein
MRTKVLELFLCLIAVHPILYAADINQIDGEWYSYKWKYGYTLKNGKGLATITNSPAFKVGQEIVRLTAVGKNSFVGENVYKDGIFYKVKVTLQPNGKLFFEGEKNVKWEMERISEETLQSLVPKIDSDNSVSELPSVVLQFIERRESCEHFLGEEPYDKDRLAFIEWSLCKFCMGTDKDLAELREKYRKNRQALSRLSGYAASVEPLNKSEWIDNCSKAKKPKSYK